MPNHHTSIEIFIAYARKDDGFLQDLLSHLSPLKRTSNVKTWHDGVIEAGTTWEKDIKDAIHRADIILLLVSAHSLNSDYFYETELTQALERHQKDENFGEVLSYNLLAAFKPRMRLNMNSRM